MECVDDMPLQIAHTDPQSAQLWWSGVARLAKRCAPSWPRWDRQTDRQTDGRILASVNAPHTAGHKKWWHVIFRFASSNLLFRLNFNVKRKCCTNRSNDGCRLNACIAWSMCVWSVRGTHLVLRWPHRRHALSHTDNHQLITRLLVSPSGRYAEMLRLSEAYCSSNMDTFITRGLMATATA